MDESVVHLRQKKKSHGHDTQEMKTDFMLVKVTWSTLRRGTLGLLIFFCLTRGQTLN